MYKILTLDDNIEWDNYLSKFERSMQDIYFTSEYYHLNNMYKDDCILCYVYEKDSNYVLYPFIKKSINSLGYKLDEEYFDIQGAYGYNGILSTTRDADFLTEFWLSFEKYCKEENIIAEFTRFHPILNNRDLCNQKMDIIFDRETVYLDLTMTYEDIFMTQYSSSNRNTIRKSLKNGNYCEITDTPSEVELESFINNYETTMKRLHADNFYYFSAHYYKKIFDLFNKNTYLLMVKNNNNEIVCSSIFFHYKDFFHYHLSGRNSKADSTVNNLMLDFAVMKAKEIGARYIHFGGGTTSLSNDNLLIFKSRFSKLRSKFYIGKRIYNKNIYDIVVNDWKLNYPQSYANHKHMLLGYREI